MPTKPDLPKFDALRGYLNQSTARLQPIVAGQVNLGEVMTPVLTWIDKLEQWSKDRLTELSQIQATLSGYEEAMSEDADMSGAYEELADALHDFRRGLKDWPEIEVLLPNPLGERAPGGPIG